MSDRWAFSRGTCLAALLSVTHHVLRPPPGVLSTSRMHMPCAGLASGRQLTMRVPVCVPGAAVLCLPCCAIACPSPSLLRPADEGLCAARLQNGPQLSLPQSTQQCSGPGDGHSVQVNTPESPVDGWVGGRAGEWVDGLGQLVGVDPQPRQQAGTNRHLVRRVLQEPGAWEPVTWCVALATAALHMRRKPAFAHAECAAVLCLCCFALLLRCCCCCRQCAVVRAARLPFSERGQGLLRHVHHQRGAAGAAAVWRAVHLCAGCDTHAETPTL